METQVIESKTRANLRYLINPKTAPAPSSFISKTSLNSIRFALKFLYYRLLRYGRFALIGIASTTLAATFIGPALPLIAAVAVPSIPVAIGLGITSEIFQLAWKYRPDRFRSRVELKGQV